ncbi:MAG: hypothetical protein ACFFAN_03320 [Promethearchaeota archaeon]
MIFLTIFLTIYSLLKLNLKVENKTDFTIFYNAWTIFISEPQNLYDVRAYYYMPSFSLVFCWLSYFDITNAYFIFLAINLMLGILCILEFDKIMKLLNVDKNLRIIFLLIALFS